MSISRKCGLKTSPDSIRYGSLTAVCPKIKVDPRIQQAEEGLSVPLEDVWEIAPQVDFQVRIPGQELAELEDILATTPHVSSAPHLGFVGKSE